MMEHLTETQLNEYLDNLMEAPAQARVQAHLSDCADCRDRLASLQIVFQALDALPEEIPVRNLASSVLSALPKGRFLPVWWLVFAVQAGLDLGLLLLIFPLLTGHITRMMVGLTSPFIVPAVKFPLPIDLHFSLPVFHLPHVPALALPFMVTPANFSVWLILGIAASLLFIIGNFSLLFRSNSKGRK